MADISRRTLLNRAVLASALGGGALLGLTRPVRHQIAKPPPPAPAALTAALDRQRRLLAGYDQALASPPSHPGLAGLRADVAAHGEALQAVLQRYPGWRLAVASSAQGSAAASGIATGPGSTATPGGTALQGTVAALAAASRSAAAATTKACLDWPAIEAHAAEVLPLLGSIAACLTSHAQVLG